MEFQLYRRKNLLFTIVLLTVFACAFYSCKTTKPSLYFEDITRDTTIAGISKIISDPVIVPGDNLGISINSLSIEENERFNSTIVSAGVSGASVPSYLVSETGTIKVHRLGEFKAAGFTRKQLAMRLQDSLKPYLKEPLVIVSFLNHKVTVMGAVSKPGVVDMKEGSLTILEALALSGDIIKEAKKDNVLVIRDNGSERQIKKINLENTSVFSSSWYYLQPNDIVYVTPDYSRLTLEDQRRNRQTTISLLVSAVSIVVLILSRVIK